MTLEVLGGGPGRETGGEGQPPFASGPVSLHRVPKKPREYGKFTGRRADPDSSLITTTQIKPNANSIMVQTPRSDFLSSPAPSPPKVMYQIEFDTRRLHSHVNAPQIGPAEEK